MEENRNQLLVFAMYMHFQYEHIVLTTLMDTFIFLALNIRCQLNLIRGQISQNPDVHRFIPAFFTYSGTKKNIPEFLSSRWSHKLPKEVDRIIFHLLNVEKIQPYRTQPIIVMGGNGHPFDEKKKELERAVQEAEAFHRNNNLQNV